MNNPLRQFHPIVRDWFENTYGEPTDIQARAWPVIARGDHALITAPTGSGKTLTAFLWALQQLFSGAWPGGAPRVLYVSPMKALNNDIQRNLMEPLEGIRAAFAAQGESAPEIRVQTRSGDTPASERRRMVQHPPEILITTPESLNLLHSSPKARSMLTGIQTVIIDEIHAVAATKRGVHLFTAVERLLLHNEEFQRIALSATVKPFEAIADLVGGYSMGRPAHQLTLDAPCENLTYTKRAVQVVQSHEPKVYELRVSFPPVRETPPDDASRWPVLTDALKRIIDGNTSTLIFTNTRRHCERISLLLNHQEETIRAYAHHGSLSREIRAVVERRLKEGSLPAIVATNSLELGIDIGALDEVVLVQTPFSAASTIQRLGRAGHRVGEVSRGVLFPLFSRDILEAAVMTNAVQEGDIEPLRPVHAPLDVLAQVIASMTGVDTWNPDTLFAFLRSCASYHRLQRDHFDLVLKMLNGRYADTRIRALQSLLTEDADNATIRSKPQALRTIYSSGGTIPDRGYFNLRLKDSHAKIGELDEEFVWERHLGEVFALGNQTWKIHQITHNDVLVTRNDGTSQHVPFWKADSVARGFHFSGRTAEFLEAIDPLVGKDKLVDLFQEECALDKQAATALADFLKRQRDATRTSLPHRHHVLIERCTDHRRGREQTQIMLHTLWGGAVNRPVAFAFAQAWEDRFGGHTEVFADNDSIVFVLPESEAELDLFDLVKPDDLEDLLRRKLETTGLFGARFRENAARALLLPRQHFGKRMPLWMTRLRSKRLFDAVSKLDDFPIIIETWRTLLQDEFELDHARMLLREVHDGVIVRTEISTTDPSPFAAGVIWGQTNKYMYSDDTPIEVGESALRGDLFDSIVHTQELRPSLSPDLVRVFQEKSQRTFSGYSPKNAAEVIDWITERVFLPDPEWEALTTAIERDHGIAESSLLRAIGRKVVRIEAPFRGVVARAELGRLAAAFNLAPSSLTIASLGGARLHLDGSPSSDNVDPDALGRWFVEWFRFYGPIAESVLIDGLPWEVQTLRPLLESLTTSKALVSGLLIDGIEEKQFCDAENYETLLRWTRRENRADVRPRPLSNLPLFLARWQGIIRDGDAGDGLQPSAQSLLGLPCHPCTLEQEFLPVRVPAYDPTQLDSLMKDYGVVWIGQKDKRIWLTLSDSVDLFQDRENETTRGSRVPSDLLPSPMGRYTLGELMEHTNRSSSELTGALWDEVWEGRVSNDSFDALRKGIRTKFASPTIAPSRTSRRSGFRRWLSERPFEGHWYAVTENREAEDELEAHERAKDRVRVLLDRYGILHRALLAHERKPLRWGAVFRALRIMELSGEVVSGQFFENLPGLQFILPEALQQVQQDLPEDAIYWMNATDPACLCGADIDGLKGTLPRRLKTTHLVYQGSTLRLVSEKSGKSLRIEIQPEDPDITRYFVSLEHLLNRASSRKSVINVETINDVPATRSPYVDALRERFEVHIEPRRVSLYRKV